MNVALRSDVRKLDVKVAALAGNLTTVQEDISLLKSDVAVLKTDVTVLKTDVAVLKTDVADLKADTKETRSVVGRIASTVALTQERVKRIEERMLTKDDLSLLLKHMDGFAKLAEDSRYRWAIHSGTLEEHAKCLDDHELRLKRVETPRA